MNIDAKTLFQTIGEQYVELIMLRQQLNTAMQVLAETKQKLKQLETPEVKEPEVEVVN